MKKIILLTGLILSASILPAQEKDSRIFIHPGRETFVYFPSDSLQSDYTVTFFLPEERVPLSRNYPVIVVLGLTPKQAQEVAVLTKKAQSIVIGINFEEKDYVQKSAQISRFLSYELLPYVDTNYWTLTGPENRILAAYGKGAAKIALQVAQNQNLFGALALFSPADVWEDAAVPSVRTLVTGTQAELANTQQAFEKSGKKYGPDFALRYTPENRPWFQGIDAAYLRAPAQEVEIKRLQAALSARTLPLSGGQESLLRVWAVLNNKTFFHYIPLDLRLSPPYLSWNPQRGALSVISGAVPATVKIHPVVDKPAFTVKIKLKKQEKGV